MKRINRTPGGRLIAPMTLEGLSRLANQLEEDIAKSDANALRLERAEDLVAMNKEGERGDRLRKEFDAVEKAIEARELDRHQLEMGGHYSQDPT